MRAFFFARRFANDVARACDGSRPSSSAGAGVTAESNDRRRPQLVSLEDEGRAGLVEALTAGQAILRHVAIPLWQGFSPSELELELALELGLLRAGSRNASLSCRDELERLNG